MKTVQPFFVSAVLTALLAGCFDPITAVPPQRHDGGHAPFTVDVLIGGGGARSIAGPGFVEIKKNDGIRNFMQLIVLDEAGEVCFFQEDRRESVEETAAVFTIENIPYGKEYHFLLLMGYWEHDGSFNYYDGVEMPDDDPRPPTLLTAGLTSKEIKGSGTARWVPRAGRRGADSA
jgi:hypothetical protein